MDNSEIKIALSKHLMPLSQKKKGRINFRTRSDPNGKINIKEIKLQTC